jgi:ribose transport system permease protein
MLNRVVLVLLVVLFLFVFGEIIFPGFMSLAHIMDVLRLSVFLGIVALAQTIVVISGNDGVDLSVGSVLSIGAIVAASLMDGMDRNIPLAIGAVAAVGFSIGAINGAGVSYFAIPPLVMTLAMASVVEGISLIFSKGFPTGNAPPLLQRLGSGKVFGMPYLVLLWIVIIFGGHLVLMRTKPGKILYGIGENNLAAELSGVRTKRFRLCVYGMGSMICALSGLLLLGYTGTPYLNLGVPYVLPSVVAVVIGGVSLAGGMGTYLGTAAGCIVLTTLTSILIALQTGEAMRQVVYGIVILILLATSERPGVRLRYT